MKASAVTSAATLALDVSGNIGKVAERRSAINEARHLRGFGRLVELIEVVADMATHLFAGMAPALGLRGIEHLAEFGALGAVDGVAHGVLGR